MKKIAPFLLGVISAALLVLAFPDYNWSLCAWFAFVPLFWLIDTSSSYRKAFCRAYGVGLLFFLGTIWWLIHVTLPGMLVVVMYLAVFFGIFALGMARYKSEMWAKYVFYAPALWVSVEWLRANLFTGFGWVLAGHSQSFVLPVIQIADIFGAYGVSFIVVMVNGALYYAVKYFNRKNIARPLTVTVFIVFLVVLYGFFRMQNVFTGDILNVAVVQGNIPQDKKWNEDYKEAILTAYERLTRRAIGLKPDLIVWPETSVPGFLTNDRELFVRICKLSEESGIPLLVGTVREEEATGAYYNSAVLLLPDGRIADTYDKIHLVPFGEYTPFKKYLSFVDKVAPVPIGDCAKGTEYKVFSFFMQRKSVEKDMTWKVVKRVRFSPLICFEGIFPGIARECVKRHANFLVNITNDAWYKKTSAAYQHAQNSVFRAVENRVSVVRAANTGVSCIIDQKGAIVETVRQGGEGLFVDGVAMHRIILAETRTLYTAYGDIFVYVCMLWVLVGIVRAAPSFDV